MKDGYIKVAAAAPELKVADIDFNAECICETIKAAAEANIALLILPELCLTASTCGDLFFQKELLSAAKEALLKITQACPWPIVTVIGMPFEHNGSLYDCAVVVCNGTIVGIVPKSTVSATNSRWFKPAPVENSYTIINGSKVSFGKNLIFRCENMSEFSFAAEIGEDFLSAEQPSQKHAKAGANIIVNLSADAELATRTEYRKTLVKAQSARLVCGYIFSNANQEESTSTCVFSGDSYIAENGNIVTESKPFASAFCSSVLDLQLITSERAKNSFTTDIMEGYELLPFDLPLRETRIERPVFQQPFVPEKRTERVSRAKEVLEIQAHALKKRLVHTGAKKILIGVSGGLDSTLALLVSAAALDLEGRSHKEIIAFTMPCFGTTSRTKSNAEILCEALGTEFREADIKKSVRQHFKDIGHDGKTLDSTFENAQARERTQLLMDSANMENGITVGTGDLSELAIGWATFNGDHMSMYSVNSGISKTLIRAVVDYVADNCGNSSLKAVLKDILATPVSPELLPAKKGEITQKTEDLVGPYELHDFFLYYMLRYGFRPSKICRLARHAFGDDYPESEILKWLRNFYRRFFSQQFKRNCCVDGPQIGSVTLCPHGGWIMPSDAMGRLWLSEMDKIDEEYQMRSNKTTTTYEQFKKNRKAKMADALGKQNAVQIPSAIIKLMDN